jgi:tight adherence protein B
MTPSLVGLALALTAAYGVFLVVTARMLGWRGVGVAPGLRVPVRRWSVRATEWLGLGHLRPVELFAVEGAVGLTAAAVGYALFGGLAASVVVGLAGASVPPAAARAARRARLEAARDTWPRMLEELRLQVVSVGRPIPQALLGVGLDGSEALRAGFAAAQREWAISTDLDRTLAVLKQHLADPTADAVCETLLVAHELGGTDIDQRLRELIDDRTTDLQARRDARAKQAGVRFSRWFVLLVPLGMAVVGAGIGDGRDAYRSTTGQMLVLAALGSIAACWAWAGWLLRLPEPERVFVVGSEPTT